MTSKPGAAVDIAIVVALVILAYLGFPKETIMLTLGSLVGARIAQVKQRGGPGDGPGNAGGSAAIALMIGLGAGLHNWFSSRS